MIVCFKKSNLMLVGIEPITREQKAGQGQALQTASTG